MMSFPISAGLLDSMVLAIVSTEDTYGYEITQTMRKAVDVSESTLYPVLKRLRVRGADWSANIGTAVCR